MKILAISDTHGDLKLIKKTSRVAKKENVDLIIHAGDLTWFNKNEKGIIKPLAEITETLIIPGNHDTIQTIKELEKKYKNITNIHKKNKTINGIGFFGSGTTDWGFTEDSKKLFQELKESHTKIKNLEKKILITHSPPKDSSIEEMGFPGSYAVRKAIKEFKPKFVICGHIHEGGGLIEKIGDTTVINAAKTPIIFEI